VGKGWNAFGIQTLTSGYAGFIIPIDTEIVVQVYICATVRSVLTTWATDAGSTCLVSAMYYCMCSSGYPVHTTS
jgi:hypothetical protein